MCFTYHAYQRIASFSASGFRTHVWRELHILLCHSPLFLPAPLFPDSHKQWVAKVGYLGSWGNAAMLRHNAFIVFQIKQQTCM